MTQQHSDATVNDLLTEAQDRLFSGRVAILTGAGISAESGIATYRDHDKQVEPNPLWEQVDPREMATPRAFRKNRNRVWRWYMNRLRGIRATLPNQAHELIADLAFANPQVQVFTQNVDGLHEATGTSVGRLHGSAQHYRCRCGHVGAIPEIHTLKHAWPYCEVCGSSRTRPDVVWFGEGLPEVPFNAAWNAFTNADLKLVIGTSAVVYPVAVLPLLGQGMLVEINPEQTELTPYAHLSLSATASAGLDALLPSLVPVEI